MKTDPQLHHTSVKIVQGSLESVIHVFELLGCQVFYRHPSGQSVMVGQHAVPLFDIQLTEVQQQPQDNQHKVYSHVAFISEDPAAKIEAVEVWAKENKIAFTRGGWSERELWFDLPDLFVDFVIEVMHVSITEE